MTALLGLAARLKLARLYLCTDTRSTQGDLADFLTEAFLGGVDIIQVREKNLDPDAELAALETARTVAHRFPRAIVCVNDSPELARRFNADMVHLGQTDGSARKAKQRLHQWALLGRSTHAERETDQAIADDRTDYFCVGPVYATPTKPDYVPVGLELVSYAARVAPPADPAAKPWFAIGGIDATRLDDVIAAGARRICVVRAITQAADPRAAAAVLSARLRAVWDEDPALRSYAFGALD
ncbi:MAG TPA: thiamine phosphate synthase [Microlunatus sp.]|nr:thiamine phosphate synthase [Microlunatus sp.]